MTAHVQFPALTVDDVRRMATSRNIAGLRALSGVLNALSLMLQVATDEMEARQFGEAKESLETFQEKLNETALMLARKMKTR